jgi:hypothetical protein
MILIYEELDSDITWAMLTTEKEVTTGSNGAHAFSPAFSDAGNAIRHWKRQIRLRADDPTLTHVLIPSQVEGVISSEQYLRHCRTQLADSWTKFRNIKAESKAHRKKYLDTCLADAKDEAHRANTLRKIISAEAASRLYRRLRFYIKGETNSSIDHVLVPDADEPTGHRRVSEKGPLFQSILDRNLHHFGQAAPTPFVEGSQDARSPPLQYTPAHKSMLHGNYTAENTEDSGVQNIVENTEVCVAKVQYITENTEDSITRVQFITENTEDSIAEVL